MRFYMIDRLLILIFFCIFIFLPLVKNFEIKPNPLNKYDFLLEDKEIYAIKKKENE